MTSQNPAKKERAILIVHGFGGDEREILYLHDFLENQGLATYWVRLSGHGAGKKELGHSTYQDWLKSVDEKISALEQDYEHVTCVGFSMGGLLLIQLMERASIDQLVLCNSPIYLYNVRVLLSTLGQGITGTKKGEIAGYFEAVATFSVRAGIEFLKVLVKTKQKIRAGISDKLQRNYLIIQNKEDETSHFKSGEYLSQKLGRAATLRCYEGGDHQLFQGGNKQMAAEDIYAFITVTATQARMVS